MPSRLSDFRCKKCDTLHESYESTTVSMVECPKCGGSARRVLSVPKIALRCGVDASGMPSTGDRWARAHVEQARHENKPHVERAKDLASDARKARKGD